jgi:hypothetical protein
MPGALVPGAHMPGALMPGAHMPGALMPGRSYRGRTCRGRSCRGRTCRGRIRCNADTLGRINSLSKQIESANASDILTTILCVSILFPLIM